MALALARVRALHYASLAAAVVLALLALLVLTGPANATARWVLLVVLLAVLGLQGWLFLQDRRALERGEAWSPPSAAPVGEVAAPAAPWPETPRMVIRCKQCGEVFPVEDTGARPLVAACPHCGKSGTIKVKKDAVG